MPTRRHVLAAAAGALGGSLSAAAPTADASPSDHASPSTFVTPRPVPGWPAGTTGFHFGVACAGFQCEGSAPDSNWRRYTTRAASTGSIDPLGDATDFRHRYRADIARAQSMGVNTFRLSIEWARVEPSRGRFSAAALRYYDDVIDTIVAAQMTPMVTLVHYVYPGWVADQGGFCAQRTVADFERYARMITERYADRVTMWITFNEPVVFFAHELEIGSVTTGDFSLFLDNVAMAHRAAHRAAHAANRQARVGSNEAFLPAVTPVVDALFFDRIGDTLDFVGVDYYYGAALSNLSAIYGATGEYARITPQPDDIYQACHHYAMAFPGVPIYIVENGMPTENGRSRSDGYTRADFLHDTLFWLQRARGEGLPVVGYNHWSITDNYEWGSYTPRFGLYRVDVLNDPTLARHPTSGVTAYRSLIGGRGPAAGYRPRKAPATGSVARIPQSVLTPSRIRGPRALL